MSCRIDLNGSTEKFNGSYCQRYELASLLLSRYCQRYVLVLLLLCEASRMGSLDCFCVILHWDFNVKIKWESKNLKIQYFSVFWDWLWLALIWYKPYSFGGFCVANLNMSSIGENNVLDYSDIYHLCPQLKYLIPSKPVILRQAFAKSLWVHIGPALLRLQKLLSSATYNIRTHYCSNPEGQRSW